jgi:hypothetical protein
MADGLGTADNPGLKVEQLRPSDWLWICHDYKLSGNQTMIARADFQPVDNPRASARPVENSRSSIYRVEFGTENRAKLDTIISGAVPGQPTPA